MMAGANVCAACGKSGSGEADEAVAAQLQQDAGQDHRARRRGLDVGVGQPGVEREHRDLDREGQEEREEGAELQRVGEAAPVVAKVRSVS